MSAENHRSRRCALSEAELAYRRAAFAGWSDAQRRSDFRPEYDGWSCDEQLAYESARLAWANLALAQIAPPAWRSPDDSSGADRLATFAGIATRRVGSALPPDMAE